MATRKRMRLTALLAFLSYVAVAEKASPNLLADLAAVLESKLSPLVERVENLQAQVNLLLAGQPVAQQQQQQQQQQPQKQRQAQPQSQPQAAASKGDGSRIPRTLEKQRWKETYRLAKQQGYKIKGFYHVSAWRQYWNVIMADQLSLLDGRRPHHTDYEIPYNETGLVWGEPHWTSLLTAADSLYLNVVGPDASHLGLVKNFVANFTLHPKHRSKFQFHFNKTIERSSFDRMTPAQKKRVSESNEHLSEAEVSTVNALHNYCVDETKAGRKAFVFYIHNKGACCYPRLSNQRDQWPVAGWRDVMNAFNLEFPSVCLRALMAGYSTCGYGSQIGHYTGNFWWADCGHIAALPPLWSRFDAYAVEYYVMNVSLANKETFERNCAYETYHCLDGKIDHYAQHCPRNSYMDVVNSYVAANAPLPRIKGSNIDISSGSGKDFCRNAWKKGRYQDQPGWRDGGDKSIWKAP